MKRSHRIVHALLAAAASLAPGSVAYAASGGALKLIPELEGVVILLIGFTILIPIVNRVLVKPVFAVLDEREEKITAARNRAKLLEDSANEVLARYQSSIREVREDAERQRREQLDAARAEHAEITERARGQASREIEQSQAGFRASLDEARTGLRATAEGLARQAAERILGRAMP